MFLNLKNSQFIISFLLSLIWLTNSYLVPTPTLELLSPKGFRVSIPDDPGLKLFAFHGAINHEVKSSAPGDFSGEIRQPTNGRWVYENRKVVLDPGDTLHYWIYIQHGNHAYRLHDKSITIPQVSQNDKIQMNEDETGGLGGDRNIITTSTTTYRPSFAEQDVFDAETSEKTCIPSKTKVRGRSVCSGELIFEDNFDSLNWTKWKKEIRLPIDLGDAEFVLYHNRPENCYIQGGNLFIVPTLLEDVPGFDETRIRSGTIDLGIDCTGIVDIEQECKRHASIYNIMPPVVSARIRTKDSFSFVYGRIEIRARLPRGDWLFPQIFLEPYTNDYGINGYASGQMRVAFIRANEILESKDGNQIDGHRLSGGVVLTKGEQYRDVWLKNSLRRDHLGRSFHTYSLTWTEEAITLSVDGNDYATLRGGFSRLYKTHNITHAASWERGGQMAPFDREFFIVLGVAAGGISDFPDDCRTGTRRQLKPWTNRDPKSILKFWNDKDNWYPTWEGEDAGLEVDYVRVWAL